MEATAVVVSDALRPTVTVDTYHGKFPAIPPRVWVVVGATVSTVVAASGPGAFGSRFPIVSVAME